MSDSFTAALIALGLTESEVASFLKDVDDYFLNVSRESWSVDLQLVEAQRRYTEMQPKLVVSKSIAAKLNRPWPDPAPSAAPPVPIVSIPTITNP